jgi:hypothetical protein
MNRFQWLRLIILFLSNIRITSSISEGGVVGGEIQPIAKPKKPKPVPKATLKGGK